MRYVFRKKLNYPYDNPLIQSEAKGTLAITPERMGPHAISTILVCFHPYQQVHSQTIHMPLV